MLAKRVYGLCLGRADVCDHNALREDLALQTAMARDEVLASAPAVSRLEVLIEPFIASRGGQRGRAPRELVLDVDATYVPLHGAQEHGFFHGYYDNYY